MADLNPIRGSFKFDTSGIDRAMGHAERRTRQFSSSSKEGINSVTKSTNRMSLALSKIGAVVAGIGIAAMFAKAGRSALKFETSLQQIVGLVGVSQDRVNKFNSAILDMAPKVGKGPAELADAMFFITSAGLKGKTALDALNVSARAAAAGLGNTKQVADAVTSAVNAYATSGLTAAQATDTMVATVREGKLEASQLSGALGRVLAVAEKAGVSFNEVGASVAALTRIGLSAAEAVTGVRGVLVALNRESTEGTKILNAVGLSYEKLRTIVKEKGLLAALTQVSKALGGNSQQLTKVFSDVESVNTVLGLTGGNAKQVQDIFKRMTNTTGTLDKAFEAVAQTAQQKLNRAMATFEVIGIRVASIVLPVIADALLLLARNLDVVAAAVGVLTLRIVALGVAAGIAGTTGLTGLIGIIARLTATVSTAVTGFATLSGGLGVFSATSIVAASSWRGLVGLIKANPFIVAAAAVAGLAGAFRLLESESGTIRGLGVAITGVLSGILFITAPITSAIAAIVAAIVVAADSVEDWGKQFSLIPSLVDVVNAAVALGTAQVVQAIAKMVQDAINAVISVINSAIKGISSLAKDVQGFVSAVALIDPKFKAASQAINALANIKPLSKQNFVSDLDAHVQKLGTNLQTARKRHAELVKEVGSVSRTPAEAFQRAFGLLKNKFQQADQENLEDAFFAPATGDTTGSKTTPGGKKGKKAKKGEIDDVTKSIVDQIVKLREQRVAIGLTDRQLEEYRTTQQAASAIGSKLKNVTVEQRQALAEAKTVQELANVVLTQNLGLKDQEIAKIIQLLGVLEKERQLTEQTADAQKRLQEIRDVVREVGASFEQAFTDAIVEGKSLSDVLKGLEKDLLRLFIQKAIFGPLFGGEGGGIIGKLIGGLFGGTTSSAQGNVMKFAQGGITGPAVFPMARGVGLVGDNPTHKEAIMPLVRSSSGDLGVRVMGAGGGGSNVVVNVYAPEGSKVTQDRQQRGDKEELNLFIDQAVAQRMRPGGASYRAIRNAFGLQQQTVTR